MRRSLLATALVLAFASEAFASAAGPVEGGSPHQRSVYLVEFEEPPLASYRGAADGLGAKFAGLKATSPEVTGERKLDVKSAASKAYRSKLGEMREDRLAKAGGQFGRTLAPLFVYDVVNNGVALELDPSEAKRLAAMPGIARVTPDWSSRLSTDAGPEWVRANQVWQTASGTSRGEGAVVALIDSGINRTHPSFKATGPADGHVHRIPAGFTLKGFCATQPQECGTISTDASLPGTELQRCVAEPQKCAAKLIGIYDFTTTGSQETDDGSDVDGHGSHVGSTIVGNTLSVSLGPQNGIAQQRQLSGVAPHASIISYKACEERPNDSSTCLGSWTIAALNQAVSDQVDVINFSIGGQAYDPWAGFDAVAMRNARQAGVVVVVAAGNEGPEAGSIESPGDAPWVLGVAAATHSRTFGNRVFDLTGGASAPPADHLLVGAGATGGLGARPVVFDPLFPGCSQGSDLDGEQTGVSNPWQPGRFNGEIVVCERGVQARVAKSNNVRLAGGGGMILVNTQAEDENIVSDSHRIPTVHLGFVAGQALKSWLSQGSAHAAKISGDTVVDFPEFGDRLAAFSGRGPALTPGILKPDVSAPGVAILAADAGVDELSLKSGTSMASPHVAGAAALIRAAKPAWTPSQVESALATTARSSVRVAVGNAPSGATDFAASAFDAGSGTIDVSKAIRAGLYFDVTDAEFRAANPGAGGQPRDLNRPSIVHDACFERCSVNRRVTEVAGGGSWRVEADFPSPAAATVTPSTFTLTTGQSQNLAISFDVSDASFPGTWVEGRLRFVRTGGAPAETAEVPVALFADAGSLPASIAITTGAESGYEQVSLSQLVALPQADFRTTALVAPVVTTNNLAQDPTRNDRYDGFATGLFHTTVVVPAASTAASDYTLIAESGSATAYDVDLFVGEDLDADGLPEASEELCASTGDRANERCEIGIAAGAAARRYWVLVQNWDAGASGAGDTATAIDAVTLQTILVSTDGVGDGTLTATGPGRTASRQSFPLRLSWDDPSMLPGERRVGFLEVGANRQNPGQVGRIRVDVQRTAPPQNAGAVLDPNGTRRMRLAAGASQDRLFLDVPANASSLTVSSAGTGEVDLYLARAESTTAPAIAAAPARGLATGTSIHPGATETITLSGAALPPGRWYVTPVNPGSTAAEFDLTVSMQYGAARPAPRFGVYYNPGRSGSGLHLFPGNNGTIWGASWYTYLEDGTPTWYFGTAPAPTAQQGVWRLPLQRFSWDGSAAKGTNVAVVQLAFVDANRMTFSFELDGQAGSEPLTFIDAGGCPQLNGRTAALSGVWYSPARSGTGHTLNAHPGIENNGTYIYDGLGIARWVLAQASPFGPATMPISQLDGFCPLCTHKTPTLTTIGSLTRSYASDSSGNIKIDLQFQAPVGGSWNIDLPMQKLSDALPCQ